MKKTTIAFFEVNEEEIKYFKSNLKENKLLFFKEKIQEIKTNKYKEAEIISVFIYSKVSKEIIAQIHNLKSIITRSTGYDHIDTSFCKENNITVSNVPYYGENTVAEHGFALLLNLSRNISKSYVRGLNGNHLNEGLQGFDLMGKTIGIIGAGHIGMHMIRMSRGFGMNVLVYDLNQDKFLADILGFKYSTLDEIIRNSDVISLHIPYNPKTHHFIDEKKMKKMKKGVILINTSRGALIDTKALYDAIKNKQIGGCGLDVIEGEELMIHEDNLLKDAKENRKKILELKLTQKILSQENVIFTPHNGFNSKEAIDRIKETTLENINSIIKNKKTINSIKF